MEKMDVEPEVPERRIPGLSAMVAIVDLLRDHGGRFAHAGPYFEDQRRGAREYPAGIDKGTRVRNSEARKQPVQRTLLRGRGPALAQDVALDLPLQAAFGCDAAMVPSVGEEGAAL